MKKNILLVQSLLVLPFLSSHMLLCMNSQPPKVGLTKPLPDPLKRSAGAQRQQSKGALKRARKKARDREAAARQAQLNSSAETDRDDDEFGYQIFLTGDEKEIRETLNNNPELKEVLTRAIDDLEAETNAIKTDIPTIEPQNPEPQITTAAAIETITTNTPQAVQEQQEPITTHDVLADLGRSVLPPVHEKGLGLWNSFTLASYRTQIISHLKKGTFETDNKSFFDLLSKAIQESIAKDDIESLSTILALCQTNDNYKKLIRLEDQDAQSAFASLSEKYKYTLNVAHAKIQSAEDRSTWAYNIATTTFVQGLSSEIEKYKKNVGRIGQSYNDTSIEQQKRIANFTKVLTDLSALNADIRKETKNLLETTKLTAPEHNPILKQHSESDWRLKSILRTGDIPTIATVPTKQIDNK